MVFTTYIASFAAYALQPPTKEQLARYKKQGSLQEKVVKAKSFGNFKGSSHLTHNANQYLTRQLKVNQQKNSRAAPISITPRKTGFGTTGNQKTFTLLLAFSDAPAPEHQSPEVIYNHIYGEGLSERFPNESLTNFYSRSSYGQLTMTGEVLPWYTTTYPRDEVVSEQDIIKEALRFHEEQGVDFSQYDNDGDGTIDYFSVIWTGEVGEWASLWWAYQTSMYAPDFLLSKKTLGTFSWQWLSSNNAVHDFDPGTLIHETGHALGLPDYYDYDYDIGPDLEFPIADMMRNNRGDHNAFSKFLLGWLKPQVIGSGSQNIQLQASSSHQDALIIMPDLTLEKGLSEYFVVQHRDQQGNDVFMLDTGLLIWHVDATPDYDDFKFNNSYSEHPLIKLIYDKDFLDLSELYYQPGDELTTMTAPSSTSYVERDASVEIKSIEKTNTVISLSASIANVPKVQLSGLSYLEALADEHPLSVTVESNDVINKVTLQVNGELIDQDIEAPYHFILPSINIPQGTVNIEVTAYTNTAKGTATLSVLKLPNETALMVVNLSSSDALGKTLDNFLKPVFRLSDVPIVSPDDVPAMFILHSTDLLSNEQLDRLVSYFKLGGHLYYENTGWFFNRALINAQWKNFGITATNRSERKTGIVSGSKGSVVAGLAYDTPPEGYFLFSELAAATTNSEEVNNLWQMHGVNFSHAVTNTLVQSKIIATTMDYSWFPSSLTIPVMSRYLDFFGLDNEVRPVSIIIAGQTTDSYLEGDHKVEFFIERSFDNGSNSNVTVTIESENAIEGIDYTALPSNELIFSAGELSKTVELILLDDLKADGDKELYVILTGDDVISEEQNETRAYLQIKDDERRGALQFKENSMGVAENSESFHVIIERIDGLDAQIEFTIKSIDNTAIAGVDYQTINETFTFEQNVTEKSLLFHVIDNNSYAEDKSFTLELTSDHLTEVQSQVIVTIHNDEAKPEPEVAITPVKEQSSSGGASYLLLYLLLLISGYRLRKINYK